MHLIISTIKRRGSCLLITRGVWSIFLLRIADFKRICSFYASKHQDHAFFRTQNRDQPLQFLLLTLQARKKFGVNLTPRRSFPQDLTFYWRFILRFHMRVNPPERVTNNACTGWASCVQIRSWIRGIATKTCKLGYLFIYFRLTVKLDIRFRTYNWPWCC